MLKSAKGGNSNAQNDLGWMYKNGIGVLQDLNAAEIWYKKSSLSGNVKAMHSLGNMYYDIHRNCEDAKFWIMKTAKLNYENAILQISNLYRTGDCLIKILIYQMSIMINLKILIQIFIPMLKGVSISGERV